MGALHATKQTVFTPLCLLTGLTITCSLPFNTPALAQIIPDNSLGSESSVVVPNININGINSDRIDGGAIRGTNLFHSFQEFNIDNGSGAYFSNPGNISNILTRVTGSNLSNILGTLGVLGNANLFLINPNGIVFGPNARLDVGGSFFASTADSILFENSVEFAASNPDAPPLLTINIPMGLNFRENPGNIVNQAALTTLEDGSLLRDNNGFLIPQGLNVPQNQTLALVGGDVFFDNGVAISPGSNIELGGLSEPGIVELNNVGANSNSPVLQFPSNIQQSDIILTNESQINVRADGGGNVNINAGNFGVGNGSIIRAGIDAGFGFPEAQGGDVNINAQDSVIFTDLGSSIRNNIDSNATGNPGDININANSLLIENGALLSTTTLGNGNAGNVTIQASESVQLIGGDIFSDVSENGIGNAGIVEIETAQLELRNGSQIVANTSGIGNAGNILIQASEFVDISGKTPDGQFPSGLFTNVAGNAVGNGGNISIETGQLQISDSGSINVGTFVKGNAGNISIQAADSVRLINGNIVSGVGENAIGNGGTVEIDTARLELLNGGVITAGILGRGNTGNIIVRASDAVIISGVTPDGEISSGLGIDIEAGAVGNGGNISVETNQLKITDGGVILARTRGEGNVGTITVKAENINVNGNIFAVEGQGTTTGILAQSSTTGNAGTIIIEAENLRLTDGAVVQASADGAGDAGTIIVRANDVELLNGLGSQNNSILDASVKPVNRRSGGSGTGSGGSVTVETERLVLRNGGRIEARTANGTGESGKVTITASESVELSGISPDGGFGGNIFTNTTGSADSGDITIFTGSLSIRDQSSIIAGSGVLSDTVITGNGGNIQIFATDSVELIGLDSREVFASITSETFGQGDAGNISITTNQLRVLDRAGISVSTSDENGGNAGEISINATESVELRGRLTGLTATTDGSGNAGNIDITTGQLSIRDRALIGVGSFASGIPGNINISANETLLENRAALFADSEAGQGGSIRLESNDVRLLNGSGIRATGSESGETFEGNIEIDADLLVLLGGSGIITNALSPSGGSNISIRPLDDDSVVFVISRGSGIRAAGNLTIDSGFIFRPTDVPEVAVTDPNDLIAQEFCRQRGGSEFIVTGKGGLAADPNDKADGNQIEVDLVEPVPSRPQNTSQQPSETEDNQPISSLDIIPARGWIRDESGDIILVSYDPTKMVVQRQQYNPYSCQL